MPNRDVPASDALEWRPLSADLVPVWHPLVDAVRAADGGTEHLGPEDLRDELTPAWIDLSRDSVIGLDADGVARAWGLVQVRPGDVTQLRAYCWGGVHPGLRGQGIGRHLLAWQERQARRIAAARRAELGADVPGIANIHAEQGAAATGRLATRAGFEAVRWWSVMRRDLSSPLPPVQVDAGLRLVPYTAELDEPVRVAHNEAFADHWQFQPWTPESWRQWETGHRDFRADWSFVVLDGEEVAGYALSAGYTADWEAQGWTQGWTGKLGVRRPWRGRGVAKALLAASMRAFADSGMQYAGLDVDSANPTGAVQLYTGLGYELHHRTTQYSKEI